MSAPRSVAAATSLILCLAAGCRETAAPPPPDAVGLESRVTLPSPERVAEYLGTIPTWPELQPGTPEAGAAMAALAQISELPTAVLLAAVHHRILLDHQPGTNDPLHTRLMLLNRYLFNVPSDPSAPSPFFPLARRRSDPPGPLWPLGIGPDGDPILIGHFYPPGGPPYDPLAEFIAFHHTYGRRDGRP